MSEPVSEVAEVGVTERRRSPALFALGVVVAVLALVTSLVVLDASWGLTVEYGADNGWLGGLLWGWVPASLITLAWVGLRLGLGHTAGRWWLVLLGTWAVLALTIGMVITLAENRHESDAAARSSACSPEEADRLVAVPLSSTDLGSPQGEANGDCTILLELPGGQAAALGAVVDSLTSTGWVAVPAAADGTSVALTRAGSTLVVRTAGGAGKGLTDVYVVSPAG